jgi:Zn-dependent protease
MDILGMIIGLAVLVFSIIVHEVAHGYAAYKLGDPTAAYSNRLTLNPIPHIDLFGSIILPAVLAWSGSPILGWAKPVPINPYNFRNYKRGMMITAIAGPLSNFTLVLIGCLVYHLVVAFGTSFAPILCPFLELLCMTNLMLGIFNLIPIPPLDGSRILYGLLPGRWAEDYLSVERYGIFILYGLLFLTNFGGKLMISSSVIMNILGMPMHLGY